jgi:hypothetical protein
MLPPYSGLPVAPLGSRIGAQPAIDTITIVKKRQFRREQLLPVADEGQLLLKTDYPSVNRADLGNHPETRERTGIGALSLTGRLASGGTPVISGQYEWTMSTGQRSRR